MTFEARNLLLCLSVLGGMAALSAHAAPVAPAENRSPAAADNADGTSPSTARPGLLSNGIIDRATAIEVPDQSKTIEILLEMQGKNPGLEGGERPRQSDPLPAGARGLIASAPLARPFGADDPANPFGNGTLGAQKPKSALESQGVDWNETPANRYGGAGYSVGAGSSQRGVYSRSAAGAPDDDDDADLRWLLPRPIVRFVRQNRELVVGGSVVALLLLWGGTALVSGRRK